jgi:hypothetical protein
MKFLMSILMVCAFAATANAGGWERTEASYEASVDMRVGQQRRSDRRSRWSTLRATYGSSGSTSYATPIAEEAAAPQAQAQESVVTYSAPAPVVTYLTPASRRRIVYRRLRPLCTSGNCSN